jgi:integrase
MEPEDIYAELFLEENDENAAEQLNDILEITGGLSNYGNGLIRKLNEYPDGSFAVSAESVFSDPIWTLGRATNSYPININFDRQVEGANDLKRVMMFYLTPDFNAFGRIKSYSTTKSYSVCFNAFEKYVFTDNSIPATNEGIALINVPLLNNALDRARESESVSHYHSVYFFIRFWINLSTQNLIPDEYKLAVSLSKIDNIERRKDVKAHFTGTLQSWIPFSETDIEKLLDYALFWTEEAIVALSATRDYLVSKNLVKKGKNTIRKYHQCAETESKLNIEIRGIPILISSNTIGISKGSPYHAYAWVDSYAAALDKIRNGIFILIALMTGMRIRELCALTFDDIYADHDGKYWVNIRRFKTSNDPNYHGELDTLPLPGFIGVKVSEYKHLKNIFTFQKEGYIFQSNKSRKKLNFPTPAIIHTICTELMDATEVERIHCHRFRKTIAEILIHRDEKNIHIIRLLFGHKSYAMTLRYISRNPYLVASVAEALEHNFAQEFHEIVTSISKGSYSGPAADRIAEQLQKRPDAFSGKHLKLSIFHYIAHLLGNGQPIFIQRVSVGTYCLSDEDYSEKSLPPCLLNRREFIPGEPILPDTSNCQPECVHAIVLGKAKTFIESNIKFYSNLLENQASNLTHAVKSMLAKKIAANEAHLHNLNQDPAQFGDRIIARSSS